MRPPAASSTRMTAFWFLPRPEPPCARGGRAWCQRRPGRRRRRRTGSPSWSCPSSTTRRVKAKRSVKPSPSRTLPVRRMRCLARLPFDRRARRPRRRGAPNARACRVASSFPQWWTRSDRGAGHRLMRLDVGDVAAHVRGASSRSAAEGHGEGVDHDQHDLADFLREELRRLDHAVDVAALGVQEVERERDDEHLGCAASGHSCLSATMRFSKCGREDSARRRSRSPWCPASAPGRPSRPRRRVSSAMKLFPLARRAPEDDEVTASEDSLNHVGHARSSSACR